MNQGRVAEVAGTPERFDGDLTSGSLTAAEHVGRYLWAAEAVRGRRVLDAGSGSGYGTRILARAATEVVGVDVDPDAVREAAALAPDNADIVVGDLADLPFPDGAFDVCVCFETIEHVADQSAALDELRRVLAPGGVLVISSPNRGVYPPGNPHHIHEFTAAELRDELAARWRHVDLRPQRAWLGAEIGAAEPESLEGAASANGNGDSANGHGPNGNGHVESTNGHLPNGNGAREAPANGASAGAPILKTLSGPPPPAPFTVAVAGDGDLPQLDRLVVAAGVFEVRWWQDQVRAADERTAAAVAGLQRSSARDAAELAGLRARLADAQRRLLELDGSEALAKSLSNELADCRSDLQQARRIQEALEGSLTWRSTRPLRAAKRFLTRNR
jgi:SAM-dependent methyltransferase